MDLKTVAEGFTPTTSLTAAKAALVAAQTRLREKARDLGIKGQRWWMDEGDSRAKKRSSVHAIEERDYEIAELRRQLAERDCKGQQDAQQGGTEILAVEAAQLPQVTQMASQMIAGGMDPADAAQFVCAMQAGQATQAAQSVVPAVDPAVAALQAQIAQLQMQGGGGQGGNQWGAAPPRQGGGGGGGCRETGYANYRTFRSITNY